MLVSTSRYVTWKQGFHKLKIIIETINQGWKSSYKVEIKMQLNESTFGSQNARTQKQVIEFDNQEDIKSEQKEYFSA